MRGDVRALVAKRQGLKVAAVSDGGQDVVELLDKNFNEESTGAAAKRLVDFWHVIEELGKAASVIYGLEG